jgi:hypothetical protein
MRPVWTTASSSLLPLLIGLLLEDDLHSFAVASDETAPLRMIYFGLTTTD